MNRLIPFLFLLLYSSDCLSQDYRLVQPGIIRYFTNADHYLRAVRVDSVTTSGTDTVLHLFRSPRGRYKNGSAAKLDTNSGSWLGKAIIVQPDGTHLIFNHWGDTVKIETQAALNQQWVLYDDTTDYKYEAVVSSIDTMTVLGNVDTVKTITITAKYMGVAHVTDSLHNKKIRISKNHGITTTCDLFMFPLHEPGIPYQKEFDYLTDKAGDFIFNLVNFHNPILTEIYDWEVGDVFQRSIDKLQFPFALSYEVDYISGKQVNGNEIKYIINRWEELVINSSPPPIITSTKASVIEWTVKPSLFFEPLPEITGARFLYYYDPFDTSWCETDKAYRKLDNFISGDLLGSLHCGRRRSYKKGFGETRVDVCNALAPVGGYKSYLNFVKKNGNECGSMYVLNINNLHEKKAQAIYPNPAQDNLIIQLDGKQYQVSIVNSIGQVVRTFAITKEKETIYVGDLPNGVYNLRLIDEDGLVNNQKLMVQH